MSAATKQPAKRPQRERPPALPPAGWGCQECRMGASAYVPCGKPSTRVVRWRDGSETYAMCTDCAEHNEKNRAAVLVRQGESYELKPTQQLIDESNVRNAKKPGEKLPPGEAPFEVEENREEVSDEAVKSAADLGNQAADLEEQIARMAVDMKAKQEELELLLAARLRDAVKNLGVRELPLASGNRVVLKDLVGGYIKKADKDAAHKHLEEIGEGPNIMRQFVIEFDNTEEDMRWAAKFERDLLQRKKPLRWVREESVHTGTLGRIIRERLEKKLPLDRALLGVYELTRAEIARPPENRLVAPPKKDKRSKAERMSDAAAGPEM